MGVEARCCPCNSAAHNQHMKRQPSLHHCRHCRGHCNCNRRCHYHCHCHCRCCQRCRSLLPLPLPSDITVAVAIAHHRRSLFFVVVSHAIAVTLAVGDCRLHHHWQSQSPYPLAITVAVAVAHCKELLPWRGENSIWSILANNAYLIMLCLDIGQRTDQSRMTDQASSGDGQHQHWAASWEQQAANGESGCWQQGGSRVETLPDHGGVVLLGCWVACR
jgi:hypothetical protein